MKLIHRNKDIEQLRFLLKKFSIVVLHGPRQIGKTTLAKQLNPDYYFSLDFQDIKETIYEKLDSLKGLIVIDEIHNNLDIIQKIKNIVDTRNNAKFLILGSASNLVLSASQQHIIGRAVFYELKSLKLSDINYDIVSHFLKGGFPFSFTSDEETSFKYRLDYLTSTIYRDIAESGLRLSPHLIQNFLKNAALSSGNIVNKSHLATSLSISRNTIETYITFFEKSSLIRIVPHLNKKRNPKLLFRDSGLLNCLHQIKTTDSLLSSSNLNQLWESYSLESIINEYSIDEVNYYSDYSGAEIDLIANINHKKHGIISNYSGNFNTTLKIKEAITQLELTNLLIINNADKNEKLEDNVFTVSLNTISDFFSKRLTNKAKYQRQVNELDEKKPMTFISYSHKDSEFVLKLKDSLEKENVAIYIDIERLRYGDNIKDFISDTVKITDYTVQVISIDSLRSPYVMIEYLETQLHEDAERSKKYIPVFIDKCIFDDNTYIDLADDIQKEINEVNEFIQKAISMNLHATLYNTKRDRLIDLKNHLGKAMDRLRDSLIGDFTDINNYDINIKKIIEAIK
jgi:predicted AAA+ superfamily ATPase